MTSASTRHLRWRMLGLLVMAGGYACGMIAGPSSPAVSLAGFALAITGLVLAVQGGRVAAMLRIERSRHRELPMMIHARRAVARGRRSKG